MNSSSEADPRKSSKETLQPIGCQTDTKTRTPGEGLPQSRKENSVAAPLDNCFDSSKTEPPGSTVVDQPLTVHSFSYLHTEEEEEETSRSIFDIHRKNLNSVGNQRRSGAEEPVKEEALISPKPPTSHKNRHFLPHLLISHVISDNSTSEESDPGSDPGRVSITKSPPIKVPSRGKKLYDYNDPAYSEKSRRARRRRKRSEVDIEVGLRLSRFVNRPYEGAVDKYTGRTAKQQLIRPQRRQRALNKSPLASSDDSSPVGSVERVDKSRASTAVHINRYRTHNRDQRDAFYNSQRFSRRRSISVSPPRTQSASRPVHRLLRYTGSQSYHPSPITSPGTSPPASLGSASPALLRYRRSTFKTILSLPHEEGAEILNLTNSFSYDSRKDGDQSILPLIQSCKLAHTRDSTSKKQQAASLTEVCERLNEAKTRPNSAQKMTKGSSKSKAKKSAAKGFSPQPPSPASMQKRVLLNTSLPAGSPTFQRAMKGLRPPEEAEEPTAMKANNLIPPVGKKQRVRISSASGGRTYGKKSPLAAQPKRSPSDSYNKSPDPDYDATIAEIRDKLGNLGTGMNAEPPMPKSILKNRRRSIDDLDVGTKKGLNLYLKTKHMENGLISAAYR